MKKKVDGKDVARGIFAKIGCFFGRHQWTKLRPGVEFCRVCAARRVV